MDKNIENMSDQELLEREGYLWRTIDAVGAGDLPIYSHDDDVYIEHDAIVQELERRGITTN